MAEPKIGFAFDVTNPRSVAWAKKHAAELVEGISKATRTRIRNLIVEGFEDEQDVDEIAEAIYEELDDEARAETIARTEVVRASNQGQQEAWAQAVDEGLLTGDEQKEWITTPDDRLCPTCEAMDGAKVYIWDDFDVETRNAKGEVTNVEQVTTPPAHPRCRCAMGIAAPMKKSRAAGGPGSGFHDHAGRPGEVGGSAPRGEERAPVGLDAGKKSGDWQVKWYSFPKGGAFTAKHLTSFPVSKLKTPFEDLGGKDHSDEIADLAKKAGAVAPEGYELVYRVGSPEGKTLDDKNGANADGLAIFIEQTEEKMISAGNTVHVFAVKFDAPFGKYELIRGRQTENEAERRKRLDAEDREKIRREREAMTPEQRAKDRAYWKRHDEEHEAEMAKLMARPKNYRPETHTWDAEKKKWIRTAGGPGSGNFDHAGRPGEVGGSAPTDTIGRPLKGFAKGMTQDAVLLKSSDRYPLETAGNRRFLFNATSGTMVLGANDTKKAEEWAHGLALEAALAKTGELPPVVGRMPSRLTKAFDTVFDSYGLRGFLFDKEIAIYTAPSDPAERFEAITLLVEHAVKNGAPLDTVIRGRIGFGDRNAITIQEGWPEFSKQRPKAAAMSPELRAACEYLDLVVAGGAGSGNFGHAGRPGEVGGSASGSGATHQQARQALMDAMGREIPVVVDDHPTAIRAAMETADVIKKMNAQGYEMPGEIEIRVQSRESPTGEVEGFERLIIRVPGQLPSDMTLDEAYAIAYGGKIAVVEEGELLGEVRKFTGETFQDLIVHEMGHINRRSADHSETKAAATAFATELAAIKKFEHVARQSVSEYAATNPDEFIAEAFTILYNGGTLPPEAMQVYDALRGAPIR